MTLRTHPNLFVLFAALIVGTVLSGFSSLTGCSAPKTGKARGAQLFKGCTSCHGAEGWGMETLEAPQIAGLPAWYVERQLMNFKGNIRGAHPMDEAGMRMRPMVRSLRDDASVKEVSDYVSKLFPKEIAATYLDADPAHGKTFFAACTACHGADGKGQKALNAPPLVGHHDWYLATQLSKFKAGIRGTDPKDIIGATMRPMAMTLPDEQAVRDVAAYIMTLQQ